MFHHLVQYHRREAKRWRGLDEASWHGTMWAHYYQLMSKSK